MPVVADGVRRDLTAVRAVWWRRPQPLELDAAITDPDDRSFAYGECHAAISGLWPCLDARWMNDPDRDERAARKAWQLKVAAGLGLRIPRTLITNEPVHAAEFIEQEGPAGVIYKAFSATERAWRETRLLRPDEREHLNAVRYAPVIFQEHVKVRADLRVTMVGERIFAAEIVGAPGGYDVDYRMAMHEAAIRPHTLPEPVADQLNRLMQALGLEYGAIDLRLSEEGEYVFLEVNPAGQWLFIEQRTEQPITAAVADRLLALRG